MFGTVHLERGRNEDISKAIYDGCGIALDATGGHGSVQGLARNVIIFGVDNTNSSKPQNRKNNFLVLGKGATQLAENSTAYAEHDLNINMTLPRKKFVLSIHYVDGGTSFMYVNGILMVNFTSRPVDKKDEGLGLILERYHNLLNLRKRRT